MKATLKKIVSALLVVAMAAGMLAMAPASESEAASMSYGKKMTIYLRDKTEKSSGYIHTFITIKNPSKNIKSSSVKSSKTSVVKIEGVDNDGYGKYSYIYLKAKKSGSAKITFKVGSRKYVTKVNVKKYSNPVKTVKISGVNKGKNIASKTKKQNCAENLKLSKTTKKAKLKIKAKSGWKLMEVNVFDGTNYKTIVDKSYAKGTTKQKAYSLGTIKSDHKYLVTLTLKNKKNGGEIDLSYDFNE